MGAVEEFQEQQKELHAKALRELTRASGVALLSISEGLEGEVQIAKGVDPMGLALLAFAARGRRQLRSAYRLIDASERPEANVLYRVMHEYLITSRWLLLNPDEHLKIWALNDMKRRAVVAEKVAEDPDIKDEFEAQIPCRCGGDARTAGRLREDDGRGRRG